MSKKSRFKHNLRKLVKEDIHQTISETRKGGQRVSDKTIADRWHTLWRMVEIIYAAGYKVENPKKLDERHLKAIFDHWDRRNIKAHTIHTYLSFLRYLLKSANLNHLMKEVNAYSERVTQRERERLKNLAPEEKQSEKSLQENDAAFQSALKQILAKDSLVALQLVLMRHFGLRSREAFRLRPSESIKCDELHLLRGTKGGRPRVVPIDDPECEQLLEHARKVARSQGGSMMPESYTEKAWKSYFYSIVKSAGMTKNLLGITPHSLRHAYAQELYERITGMDAPVLANGNHARDGEAGQRDLEARREIASRLGHGRYDITRFYLNWMDEQGTLRYRTTRRQRGLRAKLQNAA